MRPSRKRILQRVRTSLPPPERASLGRYLRSLRGPRSPAARRESGGEPYWVLIPRWLAAGGGRPARARIGPDVLEDLLAAQYCLFLSVRIHDDILDGQFKARGLVFAADRLALAAREMAERHFPAHSPFWRLYAGAQRDTIDAIAEVLRLQAARRTPPSRLLRAYGRVSRVLVLAAAGVCLRQRRRRDIPALLRAMDDLAIGSQMLDDLRDIREDGRRGRANYVLLRALRSPVLAHPESASALASLLAETGLVLRLLGDVRRRFHRAFRCLQALGIEEAEGLRRSYDAWLTAMELDVHRQGKRNARSMTP